MSEEEVDRLNFYSKYNRANSKQDINSLYTLINDQNALDNQHQIHIVNVALLREQKSRKGSLSPSVNHRKSSKRINLKEWHDHRSEQETQQNLDQINYKLQQLKKLERQFHEQLNRKEKENRKKKQLREQQRRQSQKNKDKLINVVESKPQPNPSRKSSIPLQFRAEEALHEVVINHQLDFDDYYRDVPDTPVKQDSEKNIKMSKDLRQKLLMQRNRQQYVESIYEQDRKTNSIVIQRGHKGDHILDDAALPGIDNNNFYQVELTHSQSQNVLPQYRFDQHNQQQPKQMKSNIRNQEQQRNEFHEQYSPARELEQIEHSVKHSSQEDLKIDKNQLLGKPQVQLSQFIGQQGFHKQNKMQQNHFFEKAIESEERQQKQDYQYRQNDSSQNGGVLVTKNKTGTQQGQEMKQQIQDRVQPILYRSQFTSLNNNSVPQSNIFLSQAIVKSKTEIQEENQVKEAEIVKKHPIIDNQIRQFKIQNKKSSFKRLMAENRSNLVPRMAISTILNEHINEALTDFKMSNIRSNGSPSLQQSIINSDNSTPIRKKRVNFKQKIVEHQLDKSHSRQSRPSFDRQPIKKEKNKSLLMNFFAQN